MEESKKVRPEDFVEIMLDSCEKQFPKKCGCCGKYFETFRYFLKNTKIPAHSKGHSLQLINYEGLHDVVAYRNCSCGTTITIQCVIDKLEKEKLVHAITEEAKEKGLDPEDIAQILRDKVIALAESKNG